MVNIDLSKYITALGHYNLTAVASRTGYDDSERSNAVTYSRLATVEVAKNDAGGETYNINTLDGEVIFDGATYNIVTERGSNN